MPRSRRRQHSRSRSRSRSRSNDRGDRDPKRRKIESFDSPHQRRSCSSEPEAIEKNPKITIATPSTSVENLTSCDKTSVIICGTNNSKQSGAKKGKTPLTKNVPIKELKSPDCSKKIIPKMFQNVPKALKPDLVAPETIKICNSEEKIDKDSSDEEIEISDDEKESDDQMEVDNKTLDGSELNASVVSKSDENISLVGLKANLLMTPKKVMSPRQVQKRLESEKKKAERESQKQMRLAEKQKLKQEREELRLKEKEVKELKEESKKKEKEEKRKEKEQEKLKKQLEYDEKNKDKLKLEELKKKSEEIKKKSSVAFVNFFVPKKLDGIKAATIDTNFKPFKIKSDMRLAPIIRKQLNEFQREAIFEHLAQQSSNNLYLSELKRGKNKLKWGKTWPYDDIDVLVIEEADDKVDLGETIVEEQPKAEKMRAKYLKFHENQRPAYRGTWRKKSQFISGKRPLGLDKDVFNYEVDSDEEWEDEVDGESIAGSDEEDKENESELENDYEVDNDFFVPHDYLSEDEGVEDADTNAENAEMHQAKLTKAKHEFDEERKSKTKKIKPRLIGCVWHRKDKEIKDAIDHFLEPLAIICNTFPIRIKKRSDFEIITRKKLMCKGLDKELIPDFLRLLHGNQNGRKLIVAEYLAYINKKDIHVPRIGVIRQLKQLAAWVKCPEEGLLHKRLCWYVPEDVRRDYNMGDLGLPNKWEYITKVATKSVLNEMG